MKHFLKTIAMFCLGAITMASCGNEPTPEAKLEVSKTELGFSQKADSKVVSVTTTGVWYVENNSDWISISPMGGKGNGAITVSVSQNASGQSRESYFSVAIDSDSKVIVVSQSATDTSEEENNGEETGDKDENGENGVIKAAFSVSADKQVYFSQGNLQYQASTKTWRFAEHQYDMIGDANKNISSTYNGWIDLFGWGTSGYNSKYPYMTSTDYNDYGVVVDKYADIAGTNYDWGVYNKISNGGNTAGMWRTLTYNEWNYVLKERTDASSLNGSATVNGVTGLILLPDDWSTPAGVAFKAGMNGLENNTYTVNEWAKMEANGAIFLPAAGYRVGTDVSGVGSRGYYWSSTADDY
ncbi:MAG: BACON domain-containing protein [Bacteroidales bacterium]|nr:BACON domain-containing protein [Bacteroidales bacterium]